MSTMYLGCHHETAESSASVDFFPVPLLDESMRAVLQRELDAEDRPDVVVMSAGLWFLVKNYVGTNDTQQISRIYMERLLSLRQVNI